MTRELNFKALPSKARGTAGEDESDVLDQQRPWRKIRRDVNPMVQMSVRMPEETYERFRALCARERRTNGDMLRVLML